MTRTLAILTKRKNRKRKSFLAAISRMPPGRVEYMGNLQELQDRLTEAIIEAMEAGRMPVRF